MPGSLINNHFFRTILFIFFLLPVSFVYGQKKLFTVNHSNLTGLVLPDGSKQDARMLSVGAADMLLEMVSKKAGTGVKNTEVLYVPVTSNISMESIVLTLQQEGWNISPVEGEPEYRWLQKDNKYLLSYFSKTKKEINLYFAEAEQAPSIGISMPNQPIIQTMGNEQQPVSEQPANNNNQQTMGEQQPPSTNTVIPSSNNGYAFTTTNFDDGWNSTVQEDWVEVTKGNIKVLLHYPKEGTIIAADPEPVVNNAWNILTAPRYSNLRNYKTAYINTYNRPYLGMGTATDNTTGNEVFLVLFRQGQTGWLEFISPDKNTFIQQFGFDPESIQWDSETELLNPLSKMTGYNKFAVAASDFNGIWTSDFTGMQQLYHVYTGNYAGMNINQSKETFEFTNGSSYNWKLLVVNGMVGSMNYAQVKSTGQLLLLNNWQVSCTDIEGKPKKYHAFFSCIKGARLLNLLDADFPGSGIYTVFGKK